MDGRIQWLHALGEGERRLRSLTPEGRKTMARGLALLSKAFGARLARLNSAQQSELATLLEKLS